MKSIKLLKKIVLVASGIAVFAISPANAADTDSTVSNETNIVNQDASAANPDALCPNGNPRGTRSPDCTVGQKGRQGGKGCQGNVSKGRGGKGHGGNVAQGRSGRGNHGPKGMGKNAGPGKGTGLRDGSCLESAAATADS